MEEREEGVAAFFFHSSSYCFPLIGPRSLCTFHYYYLIVSGKAGSRANADSFRVTTKALEIGNAKSREEDSCGLRLSISPRILGSVVMVVVVLAFLSRL